MPRGPSSAGGGMDDLISAAMMQQAAGNANAPVPLARGTTPMRAAGVPNRPAGPTNDPRMASVIANLYRQQASRGAPSAPPTAARGRTRG